LGHWVILPLHHLNPNVVSYSGKFLNMAFLMFSFNFKLSIKLFQIIAVDIVSSSERFEAKQETLYRELHSTGFHFSMRAPAGRYSK
jgi:hypothetical protein